MAYFLNLLMYMTYKFFIKKLITSHITMFCLEIVLIICQRGTKVAELNVYFWFFPHMLINLLTADMFVVVTINSD